MEGLCGEEGSQWCPGCAGLGGLTCTDITRTAHLPKPTSTSLTPPLYCHSIPTTTLPSLSNSYPLQYTCTLKGTLSLCFLHTYTSVAVSTMPSLPSSSAPMPMMLHKIGNASKADKYREAAYHQDSQGRFVAQSYEVRPSQRLSSPATVPYRQNPQSTESSFGTGSVVVMELASCRLRSKKPAVIVQSRDGFREDVQRIKPRDTTILESKAIPPAPRPRRLSTPELSDIDEGRPFCGCDSKKGAKCCTSYQQGTDWRLR